MLGRIASLNAAASAAAVLYEVLRQRNFAQR
jgi:tRNA G18 (ribose-2'-O)-methylase SpoU